MKKTMLLFIVSIFLLFSQSYLFSATYTVTEITDNGTGSTEGSLSWAIAQANLGAGSDDINFNLDSGSTVTLSAALPTIIYAVDIDGNDDGTDVTVQVTTPGTSAFRVFHFNVEMNTSSISNMIIRGGDISKEADNDGGSIYNEDGTLSLDNVTVSDSKADYGGGIYSGATLSISNSTITGNTSTVCGGGIYNGIEATITSIVHTTISNNEAGEEGGGGIYNYDTGMITWIRRSTISGNTSDLGGGIRNDGTIGEIFNCTISSNTCVYDGGGFLNLGTITEISRCTITENHANNYGVEPDDYGGGYYAETGSQQTFLNTLLANNYRGSGTSTGDDYYYYGGTLTDNGYNVVEYQDGSSTGSNKTFNSANDILYNTKADGTTGYSAWNRNNTDLGEELYLSSTLALNNNPYGTYTLTYTDGTSIGIDDGSGTDTDQRGALVYNSVKDIGAYEWEGSPGTLPVELSAFTAQYIENIPTIHWSTHSETDNMGWFIYRNSENNFSSSEVISDMIEGYGTTTQQHSYLYEDNIENPEVGDTYYYWLESVDYSGLINHYERVAMIQIPEVNDHNHSAEIPPNYNLIAGPNPFGSDLSVSYMLPQSDMVRVEIYNLYGQLVAEFNEGIRSADIKYSVNWDGKDLYGRDVASGVLLIKLITTENSQTTKAILLR